MILVCVGVIDELERMRKEHALIYFDSAWVERVKKSANNSAGIQTRNIVIAK